MMQANKTFYGFSLARKSLKKSPQKENTLRKTKNKEIRRIIKLPSVHQSPTPQSNQYEFLDLIGSGSFSKVYEGKRIRDGLKCVIKVIEKSKVHTEERRKALKREMEALKLPKHKNLTNCIDEFQTENEFCVVMEYFSRTSVLEFMKNNEQRPLENWFLQRITKQVCEGLIELHSHGMSHRDIKPDNILINESGDIKIIDFGFATTQELNEVVVAGTPQYMAPELIARKNYDPLKADIWAFGIMVYWISCGFFPQDVENKKKTVGSKNLNFDLQFPIDINPGLEYLLRKMLNPNPKERITLENILEDTWVKPKLFQAEIAKLKRSKNESVPLNV